MMTKEKERYTIETVRTACLVLEAVATSKGPMGSADIAKVLNINPNMAFRQCCTLETFGLLRMVGDEKFDLGMKLAIYWARKKSRLEGERDSVTSKLEELEVSQ